MSQPKTWFPISPRISGGNEVRNSMVKYEMQSLESSVYAGPGPREGTSASVGQASMQRVQVPQRSGAGVSGSMSSEVSNSPRKNQEPIGSLMRHVFLPIHPSPAR